MVESEGAGVSILYRLRSISKIPIRNATKAIPNNAISIKEHDAHGVPPSLGHLRLKRPTDDSSSKRAGAPVHYPQDPPGIGP
jgi:hypothetical protein